MSDPTTPAPIQVRATPTQSQINAAVRQVILALGAALGVLGYAGLAGKVSAFVVFAGPIASGIAFLWGQFETRKTAQHLATMAQAAPDELAVIK